MVKRQSKRRVQFVAQRIQCVVVTMVIARNVLKSSNAACPKRIIPYPIFNTHVQMITSFMFDLFFRLLRVLLIDCIYFTPRTYKSVGHS